MTAVLPGRRPGAAQPLPPVGEPARTTGSPVGVLRGVGAFAVRWAARAHVAVAVLAFAGLALGPHVLGYRTMTMLTASMAPGIEPGDVVVTTPLPVQDVAPGMVISYHIPVDDHRVVTHRVVSVEHGPDGAVTVRTKGDANEDVDPWTAVLKGDTAYQVRAVVPELGHLVSALRTPVISQLLVYGAPALLAGWLLMTIWRPTSRTEEDAE